MDSDDLLALIKSRRSIRRWTDQPVEEVKIHEILIAGVYAPTACNYQATRFHVIKDKTLIAKICENSAPWFKNNHPNRIILVLFDVGKQPHPLGFNFSKPHVWSRFIWQDTAASMMNMMLMAEALGLKTCWQSVEPPQLSHKRENIRRLLNISSRYVLTCMLFLGYSDRKVDVDSHRHYGVSIKRNVSASILEKV